MTSSPVDSALLCDVAPPLAAKLEFAILSVLIHHNAEIESTLTNWHLSLKLAFPELRHRTQVKKFLWKLWKARFIALKSPWIGDYTMDSGDRDLDFLELGHFTVALTTQGVVRWKQICGCPTADTFPKDDEGTESLSRKHGRLSKSTPPCAERLALSNRLFEVGLDVELAKAAIETAKAGGIPDLVELQLGLAHARTVGRDAVHALDGHLKAHGCMVTGKVNRARAVGSVQHSRAAGN